MNPIRALIVDDEPLARERLRRMLASLDGVAISGECRNGGEAVLALEAGGVDLVFLDIQMPELSGFDVIEAVGAARMPAVIFTTAYDQHALRAFEVHALDYLLKPIQAERFESAVARAVKLIRERDLGELHRRLADLVAEPRRPEYLERVLIKSRSRVFLLRLDEVDWIEAAGNYVRLHAGTTSHLLRQTLSALEGQLDPSRFLRIHRSTIVNIDRIRDLRPLFNGEYEVRLEGSAVVTLSRGYKDRLRRFLPE